ncbi:ATP-binding protein [Gilvimarinus sp. F26214L]|uniref:ATP-binding protein n=1 Tax=Gilvimarinus sp. DZF01 TaxID=3461371 RepID=UPI004045AB7C
MTRSEYAAVREAYREADFDMRLRQSKIGSALLLVLVPAGISLDFFVYPERLVEFTLLRVLCDVLIGLLFALHFVPLGRRLVRLLTASWLMAPVVMISYMIYATEGEASTYYAGIILVIIAIGILLPLTVTEVTVFSIAAILVYVAACVFYTPTVPVDLSLLFNNLYFLILAAVISMTAVFFSNRRRFNEFRLGYELESNYRELSKLDKMKSQFFANISHELRTPLGLILAPLQDLLRSEEASQDVKSFLNVANQNGMRLLKLVNDLLDLIRLEEGKQALELQPLKINQLLESQVDAISHYAQLKGISVVKRFCSDDITVIGDQPAFERIFINLLSNASKFTDEGGSITVSTRLEGNRVAIEIRDTGVGIPPTELKSIFDRFHQVDASSTRKHQGTGIGLALVKELAEKQGGEIGVESELGAGTTMRLLFPIAQVEALDREARVFDSEPVDPLEALNRQAQQSAFAPGSERAPDSPAVGQSAQPDDLPTLMIVDDEPGMRGYLIDMLKDTYQILAASDGHLALQMARTEQPDLILLDLMLPVMDGLEVCRKLKEDPRTERIKIVLLTARIDEAAKIEALRNGANDFLTKPFSSIEVRTRLENLRKQGELEESLVKANSDLTETLSLLHKAQAQILHEKKLVGLGSMAAGLLHEVQNPLSYTLAALHLLKSEPGISDHEDVAEMLQDVEEGVQRVNRIVADLETFAYPSEIDKKKSFHFQEAIKLATRFVRHDLSPIVPEVHVKGDDLVAGSEGHIVQVLVNLIRNSAKVLKEQGGDHNPRLKIIADRRGDQLMIRVWDNGPGMDPDLQARVFEPFFTTKDVGEGMGLGLSICYTIIKNHGGELQVRSEPGEWTEFYFSLPLALSQSTLEPDYTERA